MFKKTPFGDQLEWNLRARLTIALALVACAWTTPLISAQPLVLDIRVDPGQAATMQTFEVTVLEEIDQEHLYNFIQECHLRAGLSSNSAWYLAAVTDDDVLTCRSRDSSRIMEMDLETVTRYSRATGFPPKKVFKDEVTARFEPELGYEYRVRFFHGSSQTWSDWTTGRIVRSLPLPEEGRESLSEFEVETRQEGTLDAVAMSGYVKVKKLHSGG